MKKILLISNQDSLTGAPIVLLHLAKWLKKEQPEIILDILSLEKGHLSKQFENISNNYYFFPKIYTSKAPSNIKSLTRRLFSRLHRKIKTKILINKLKNKNYSIIYTNTVVSVPVGVKIKNISKSKIKLIAHIHELDFMIQKLCPKLNQHAKCIDSVITPSQKVKDNLSQKYSFRPSSVTVVYSFSEQYIELKNNEILKNKTSFHIGGSGSVVWWKGVDLFLKVASYIKINYPKIDIKFTWVGKIEDKEKMEYNIELEKNGLKEIFHFSGEQKKPLKIYKEFDIFLMTSRLDSFPLVCVEAGMLGKPIICFKGATGTEEVLKNGGGYIVPFEDTEEMAEKVLHYYNDPKQKEIDGAINKLQFSEFTPENQCPKIYSIIDKLMS